MHENILATAARLSDDALLARLRVLAIRECSATVELVAHLAELEGRKTHLGEGPGSLYKYCRDVREATEIYAVSRQIAPFRNGGSTVPSPGDGGFGPHA